MGQIPRRAQGLRGVGDGEAIVVEPLRTTHLAPACPRRRRKPRPSRRAVSGRSAEAHRPGGVRAGISAGEATGARSVVGRDRFLGTVHRLQHLSHRFGGDARGAALPARRRAQGERGRLAAGRRAKAGAHTTAAARGRRADRRGGLPDRDSRGRRLCGADGVRPAHVVERRRRRLVSRVARRARQPGVRRGGRVPADGSFRLAFGAQAETPFAAVAAVGRRGSLGMG